MTSPFERKRQQLADEAKLPADNWLARRVANVDAHQPSIRTVAETLRDMGRLFLDRRVSTNLRPEVHNDMQNTNPAETLGYISLSVIPSLRGTQHYIPTGLGYSWTPDVAMQVNMQLKDRYVKQGGKLAPTGEVSLYATATTWGRLKREEIDEINSLPDTWAEFRDQGHSRLGSRVTVARKPGEIITREEAEAMFAPLAGHVIDYFELVDRRSLKQFQEPGNFSSHLAADVTVSRDAEPQSDLYVPPLLPGRPQIPHQ